MEGLLAGGLAAPDRPRGPERLPGPAPREDIEGGAEAAEGEGDIFRSSHYLPITKEGPRDILDGRSGISDGQPHPGLSEALPRATSATHRISSCYWDGDSLDFQPGSPPPHLLGPFPASFDVQGSWEHPMVQEAREGTPSEQRFKDSVIVRTMKPYAKLKGSRKFLHHQGELKFLEKYFPSHHKFDWLQDTDEQGLLKDTGLHLDLPAQPPNVTSFRRVIVPVDDTPKTLDTEVMGTREDLEDFGEVAQPSEWGLHTSASEVATQTWTVNSEASVERLHPLLSPVQTEPYLCELLQEAAGGVDSHEEEEEEPAVFPCIECSIYFKHKEHLLEHMSQHRRAPGQEPPADLAPLACSECGWAFTEPTALEQHWQLHQASREKIIEEIQKLKQFPDDEGREARLQCPKCVFGTNSSRAFMQHAKLHVRESLPSRQAKEPFRGGSPVLDVSTLVYPSYGDSSGLNTCVHCGFTAPSKSLLREHMRLVHAQAHWEEDGEAFEDLTGQPGTSQDAYTHLPDTATMDCFSKSEPLLASVWQDNPSGYDPGLAFGPEYQQPGMRDFPLLNSGERSLGKLAFPSSPVPSASYSIQLSRDKSTVHLQRMEDKSPPWSGEEEDEDGVLTPEMDCTPENGAFPPPAIPSLIPQPALELKQTFRDALQAVSASETQQWQLRRMVPIVLMAKLRPQVIAAAARASPRLPPEELELRSTHPLDFLLLDTPLGSSLGLDTFLEGEPAMALKHEERKCPYCPDRFHNGIGLANHVRGHLNRVGVSYNVRHFISAEEVKAIERRFSFQKKKKKVANFDPGTFSLMRCDFCGAGFDTRAGLSSHARAHLRDFGITNWELTISPINILQELLATSAAELPPSPLGREPGGPPGSFLTSRRPRLPLTMPFPPTWAEDPGPVYGDASGPEPTRDIRCEFCGEFFENRKGLSSHARSHLRQMGVTEWYVNGSPIDTLREILKRRTQSRPGGHLHPPGPSPKALAKMVGSAGPGSSLEARSPSDLHISPLAKKLPLPPGSPLGHSPTASPPPTARKMFSGLATPSLPKKLKPEHMRVEIKREMLPGALHGEPHPSEGPWGAPREDMAPLNLSSRAEPVRDIRCEFCGEFFENRKGLSSHARSHLRQMGVTEWSVNGSPIDTLREILKKKSKLCLIKKEPPAGDLAPALTEDGSPTAAPGVMHSPLPLSPLATRPGKPGAGPTQVPRELSLSPITGSKPSATSYLGPVATKRPLQEDRFLPAEVKAKTYIQTELPFKAKTLHEKTSHSSTEACCELCGLYFENRKALASHARAHLRQFGVTEWCVNGSPIETLSEWIKHRPQKVGAYRSYIQGGRPFTKKFRSAGHGRDSDKRPPLGLAPGGLSLVGRSAGDEPGPEAGRAADSGERPLATSPPGTVKSEEHQRQNINKFERRQARPSDASAARGGEEANDLQQKLEEVRQPPPRVRPVPSLVPRPPQTSLVKFVGNIYTLKCRFCEVEFQGPLSIQEEWVRHLQRHILEMNFSKADPPPEEPQAPQAQTAAIEAP
ncbi:protein Wiz isoform X7 [Rattus norvegicus]|uniref:protein Wiz isoform X7 n=1 Tax=Rattus norvegicus TaxID=10116 RepID=UPI0008102BD5|nr:protein Wiz isoform X7 [Rattus norvegicus]|eukprot:XP_017450296.1 PREDICTED: protein Wiz isoform X6 [Rattus norvegicus]